MNILVITAHYPPFHAGGYEIRVKNILDELSARGHSIHVLTDIPGNRHLAKSQTSNYPITRKLHNQLKVKSFPEEVLFDLLDTKVLEDQIDRFKPDVLYLGHMYVLSKALMPYLALKNIPVVYDEGGAGLIEAWTQHGRWFRFTGDYRSRFAVLNWIKPLAIKVVCKLSRGRIKTQWAWPENMHIIFNSELNHRNALVKEVPVGKVSVIHSGIDVDKFHFRPRAQLSTPLKIIVPGRIERRKGQIDAVRLLKQLIEAGIDARLILAGARWMDGYFDEVVDEIQKSRMAEKISIFPMLSTEELVKQYLEADICFFPSYFRTGFSRVPLEAMSCGSLVISYGNEGSDEVIKDGETGIIVPPGNLSGMVESIRQMIASPATAQKMTTVARMDVEINYSMPGYIDQIEKLLFVACEGMG